MRDEGAAGGRDSEPDGVDAVVAAAEAQEADAQAADAQTEAAPIVGASTTTGWRRIVRGNRALWVTAGVAVLALVAGLVLGRFVVSPSQAAADAQPPEAGLITVPVEELVLSNDVTLRGDVTFADAVDVEVETGELGGPAIVTGQVPEVGSTLDVRSVALEVAGRPLIVLPGELPAYRTLRIGLSGPDALQLNQALASLGYGVDPSSSTYDAATAASIRALYDQVGYPVPAAEEGAAEALTAAEATYADASASVTQAQAAVQSASAGPTAAERQEQDNLVNAALRELQRAQASPQPDPIEVANLDDAYRLALLQRDAALQPGDASMERSQLQQALDSRTRAEQDLAAAQQAMQPALPASEVLYLTDLPRRVDAVAVERGGTAEGAVMSVSGATLEIAAEASPSDAALLQTGIVASFELPDGTEAEATVSTIGGPADSGGSGSDGGGGEDGSGGGGSQGADRVPIVLVPQELSPDVITQIQGSNVRVRISVESTDGAVMAVPIAALTAGPGGESRVEVSTGEDMETTLVEVTTGLAAEGFVEVTPVAGVRLEVGDLVVVGR